MSATGGRGGGPPVIAYRTPEVARRSRHSAAGIASCVLAVVSWPLAVGVSTGFMSAHFSDGPDLTRWALILAAAMNLVGTFLGIAGTAARDRSPVPGSVGMVGNIAGLFLAAGCCAGGWWG